MPSIVEGTKIDQRRSDVDVILEKYTFLLQVIVLFFTTDFEHLGPLEHKNRISLSAAPFLIRPFKQLRKSARSSDTHSACSKY